MIKILMVCHGNICRSPMAEYVMRDIIKKADLEDFVSVSSMALHRDELGGGVYPPAKKLLNAAGIDCDGHHATLMKVGDYDDYDYIIVMDDTNVRDVMRISENDPDGKVYKLSQFVILDNPYESCSVTDSLPETNDYIKILPIDEAPDISDPWYTRNFDLTWREVNAGCKALLYKLALELFPHSDKPIFNEVMREADAYTIKNFVPSLELMRRAGEAIAGEIEKRVFVDQEDACVQSIDSKPNLIGILCGKGNNAGDGLVAALKLNKEKIPVEIILTSDTFSPDANFYFEKCKNAGIAIKNYDDSINFSDYAIILDCLFGTGFNGKVRAPYDEIIKAVNRSSKPFIISADINSGLNGDTGEGDVFIISDLTIAIGSYKNGHFNGIATTSMKDKLCVDIGIIVR